jgi:glycosyltransferase involved in cell wall biosynthesis
VPSGEPLVAINARAAVRTEIGGVERYARELALGLPALRPDRYVVLAPPRWLAYRAGHAWEQAMLPVRSRGCALVISPANLAPVLSDRSVVVIHDAAALSRPEVYSSQYVAYHRRVLPLIARRARLVITVSEFSKSELTDRLGVAPERITVIPGGVDERFGPDADPTPARERYGLARPYVLCVGTASARKNLTVLVGAACALEDRGIELVLAGSDRHYLRGGEIPLRRLGYVTDQDLPGLYAGALALVMPSLHEGFGLPCLEAMACGIPVVAAAAGALPETCGGAAVIVPPHDSEAFTRALLAVIGDTPTRRDLISAGRRRAAGYSWRQTAALTDAAIAASLRRP